MVEEEYPISNNGKEISVGFISLGCAKNLVDSEIMAGALLRAGLSLAPAPEAADVVVVNTCAFVEDAREESIDTILDACRLKEQGACRAVIVSGCLPQRYREELREALPEVDAFLGVDQLKALPGVVREVAAGRRGTLRVSDTAQSTIEPDLPRVLFTGGPYAYLKVSDGCNHGCRFCAIPSIRGRYRSRLPDAIVAEAEHLLANGVRELNLVSQDVTAYGSDRADAGDLAGLLRRLGGIGGRFWIRLLYGHPHHLDDSLLAAIAAIPQVCAYLDVPIQHSHPEMLRAMGRAGRPEDVLELPRRARRVLPGIALRTTCLLGFPGETERHVEHLLAFVESAEFDHLGAFVFSPEQGTPAAAMGGQVARERAEERRGRVLTVQKGVVAGKAQKRIGTTAEILVEHTDELGAGHLVGRSEREAPEVDGVVRFERGPDRRADSVLRVGQFVTVQLTEHAEYDMLAQLSPCPASESREKPE